MTSLLRLGYIPELFPKTELPHSFIAEKILNNHEKAAKLIHHNQREPNLLW